MSVVLGIDLGTQTLKVVFYDSEARAVIAEASSPLDLYQNEQGAAEQQTHWWLNALHTALAKVDAKVRAATKAVAVSGQQHGFVALDEAGSALIPVKLWCDTSSKAECDEITAAVGGVDACIRKAGNPILPGYTASKVLWFKKNHPSLYARMHTILLPHDFLNFYLTGEACMEMGDASGTGFLDVRNRRWSTPMLHAVDPDRDLSACLPELRSENAIVGILRQEAAKACGLPPGIPVAIGGGDNMMGALGTGNVSPGKVTISLGTSGTVYAYADQPIVDPKGNIAAFCSSSGGWLPLLCTMNCTVSTELMRGLMQSDLNSFEQQLEQAPRGSEGVLTLPFFNGERTPNLPQAKGWVIGLDGRNSRPENLLRSAVEGATFALRFGVDALADLGIETREILLTGGGAKSAVWRQVVADVCNAPVTVLQQSEGAALGAALQALAALEAVPNKQLPQLVNRHLTSDERRSCQPDPAGTAHYADVYQTYQKAVSLAAQFYA